MTECEAEVRQSSDNKTTYHDGKQEGHDVQPKVGIAINSTRCMDQASDQGMRETPPPRGLVDAVGGQQ